MTRFIPVCLIPLVHMIHTGLITGLDVTVSLTIPTDNLLVDSFCVHSNVEYKKSRLFKVTGMDCIMTGFENICVQFP